MKNVSDCFQRFELLGEQVRFANKVVRHVQFLIMDTLYHMVKTSRCR